MRLLMPGIPVFSIAIAFYTKLLAFICHKYCSSTTRRFTYFIRIGYKMLFWGWLRLFWRLTFAGTLGL